MEHNVTKAILEVLKTIKKPVGTEEIAFRVRTNESAVQQQLEKLVKVHLVEKTQNKYTLQENPDKIDLKSLHY